MQKYKIWIILGIAVLFIVALLLWLAPQTDQTKTTANATPTEQLQAQQNGSNPNAAANGLFPSTSQQDTEINCQMVLDNTNRLVVNEQTRNCFEYFITQYGEKNLEQIKTDFKSYIGQNHKEPALSQILDLWERYLQYRQSMADITPASGLDQEDPAYYRSIYNSTQNLRKKFFSNYEIEGLFGTEDTYHEYTLDRMGILADKNLSEAQKAEKLKALFEGLPEDWKENLEQINKLDDLRKLTADIKARGGSADEIRQMRLNLVGAEATQRLENLDGERSQWKNSVNGYLAERDGIVKSNMSASAKQQAIQDLRNKHFSRPEDKLRVETFEQVHDQGGKLPFAD